MPFRIEALSDQNLSDINRETSPLKFWEKSFLPFRTADGA